MANTDHLFREFDSNLNLTKTKKDNLKKSKDELRDKIKKYFKENHKEYKPKFFIQGSKKIKTLIRTKEDTCDLDDGIYFFREPDVTGTALQGWVKDAVEDATSTPPVHKGKCIRVIYQGDYHIDLPVYYEKEEDIYPSLAVKNEDWELSDPKEFITWFRKTKDEDGQLIRIIKYLKSWCDHKKEKMPNGLSMTVLAEKNRSHNVRDDIALNETLKKIQEDLEDEFECIMPTTPKDDLFEDFDETRENNFITNLEDFINDSDEALKKESELASSKLWRKHLGTRFTLGEDEDEKEESKDASSLFPLITTSPWSE